MASRYGVLIRSARSSVQTSFRRSSSAVRTPFPGRTRIPLRNDTDNAAFRRRFSYISRLPVELGCALHSAVADAKLVSHLSVNSRTCSALSLGLQGYMNATLCTVPARNPLMLSSILEGLQNFETIADSNQLGKIRELSCCCR